MKNLLDNARRFCYGREMIINAFKNEILSFYHEKSEFKSDNDLISKIRRILLILKNLID